jgi:hypothetical protein
VINFAKDEEYIILEFPNSQVLVMNAASKTWLYSASLKEEPDSKFVFKNDMTYLSKYSPDTIEVTRASSRCPSWGCCNS